MKGLNDTKKEENDSKKEENGLSDRNLNIMITEHLRRLLCPIYTKAFTDLHQ